MEPALRTFFEEQIGFRLQDGTDIEGSIYIGSTEFLAVEILRDDPEAYRAEFERWLNEDWKPRQRERREEIVPLYGNEKRYSDLCAAVTRRQVVPFVGSGMSVPSGLPTWSDLLRKISGYAECDRGDLEPLFDSCAFEEAADFLANLMNRRLLSERIEHELRIDVPERIAGPIRLLPALFPDLAITTNLDDVLEHVYRSVERPFASVLAGVGLARYRSLKSPNRSCLLKLHGDCRETDGRVLLSAEYETTYATGSIACEEIALLYKMNSLLFLGCSLGDDRSVRLIEVVAKADPSMPRHYCFLADPDDETNRLRRENFLTNRGIYPIWYRFPHDEAITALLDGLMDAASED